MVSLALLTSVLATAILGTTMAAPLAATPTTLPTSTPGGITTSDTPLRNATHHTYEWAKSHKSSVINMTGKVNKTELVARGLKPTKRAANGDIEVHWQFADQETVCGDFGAVCFSPWAYMWMDWYANADPSSSPTCEDGIDITIDSTDNQLNGNIYYSGNCNIWAIFDANTATGGTVETYSSGQGVDCGWVDSYDHTSLAGGLVYTQDYYHHCTW